MSGALPPGWGRFMQPCPSCGADVLVAITERGRRQLIDPAVDPAGNTALRVDGTGTLRSRALSKEYPTADGFERVMVPHYATCKPPAPPAGGEPVREVRVTVPTFLPPNVVPIEQARRRRGEVTGG